MSLYDSKKKVGKNITLDKKSDIVQESKTPASEYFGKDNKGAVKVHAIVDGKGNISQSVGSLDAQLSGDYKKTMASITKEKPIMTDAGLAAEEAAKDEKKFKGNDDDSLEKSAGCSGVQNLMKMKKCMSKSKLNKDDSNVPPPPPPTSGGPTLDQGKVSSFASGFLGKADKAEEVTPRMKKKIQASKKNPLQPGLPVKKQALDKAQGVPEGVDKPKWEKCIMAVKKDKSVDNPYAVCNASMEKAESLNKGPVVKLAAYKKRAEAVKKQPKDMQMTWADPKILYGEGPLTEDQYNHLDRAVDWSNRMVEASHPDHDQDVLANHVAHLEAIGKRVGNSIAHKTGKIKPNHLKIMKSIKSKPWIYSE